MKLTGLKTWQEDPEDYPVQTGLSIRDVRPGVKRAQEVKLVGPGPGRAGSGRVAVAVGGLLVHAFDEVPEAEGDYILPVDYGEVGAVQGMDRVSGLAIKH